jgi:hypothetical protein
MKSNKTTWMARQGDVLFIRVAKLPKGDRKKRENGVVAYGEVTGHSHQLAVADREVAEVLEIGDGLFVYVSECGLSLDCKDAARKVLMSPECNMETMQRFIDGGATFVHEEHGPITLPSGNYRIQIQREYSPDSVRSVID